MEPFPYDRAAAVRYAHRWAYGRNPAYYDYERIGGDCTNFASQCLYAGAGVMNFTPVFGWYYSGPNEKAPAWTGVPYFYNFMLRKDPSPGPFGRELSWEEVGELQIGDFVQLSFTGERFQHTPIIVEIHYPVSLDTVLVAAHSLDADFRPLSDYRFTRLRWIHIQGVYPQWLRQT